MALGKGELTCDVMGMVLGVQKKPKKDGTTFTLVKFSDTAGNAQEAVDHSGYPFAVFQPHKMTLTVKWGEWDGRPYVNMSVDAAERLNINAMTGEVIENGEAHA